MINCKIICKAQTASRLKEIIQFPPIPPPPDKALLRLWNKREINRNIQTIALKLLQECSSWASRIGAVQIFFLTPERERDVCWKICKVRKVFACVVVAYCFQCQVS